MIDIDPGTRVIHGDLTGEVITIDLVRQLDELPEWQATVRFEGIQSATVVPLRSLKLYADEIRRTGKKTKQASIKELSKYCTDFEGNKQLFSSPFDSTRNSERLHEFEKQADTWVLVVGCAPASYEQTLQEMSLHGVEDDPKNYVRIYKRGHDAKYDLLIPDPKMPGIDFDLGIFFGYHRLKSSGRYQIGRTDFALRNLTRVRILETGEPLPNAQDIL